MKKKTFVFKRDKRREFKLEDIEALKVIKDNLGKAFKELWTNLLHPDPSKSQNFQITIGDPERDPVALRGYWHLIKVIHEWDFQNGNLRSEEVWHEYFKRLAGYTEVVFDEVITRSIANNSGCTWEDMSKIINRVIAFGKEQGIEGCELTSSETRAMVEYYNKE